MLRPQALVRHLVVCAKWTRRLCRDNAAAHAAAGREPDVAIHVETGVVCGCLGAQAFLMEREAPHVREAARAGARCGLRHEKTGRNQSEILADGLRERRRASVHS